MTPHPMTVLRGLAYRSRRVAEALRPGSEADKATAFWAGLRDYHETNEDDANAWERSRWVAATLAPELDIGSMLEIGTNSGRNLAAMREQHPDMPLRGIDVNERAIAYARERHPGIDFQVVDANTWSEPPDSWDAILTMSVLDHIPADATEELAARMVDVAAKYVICVELFDGGDGERGLYKYSRDTRELFERHGCRTVRWEVSPGQYSGQSPLHLYIGATSREQPPSA
jgi:SAM-dependent methyltransferase